MPVTNLLIERRIRLNAGGVRYRMPAILSVSRWGADLATLTVDFGTVFPVQGAQFEVTLDHAKGVRDRTPLRPDGPSNWPETSFFIREGTHTPLVPGELS